MTGPLGRYEPPPGSVVSRSGWRIPLSAAASGYGAVLLTAPLVIAALLAWLLTTMPAVLATNAWVESVRHAAAAPWTAACAFLAVAALGATKRCFGFGGQSMVAVVIAAAVACLLVVASRATAFESLFAWHAPLLALGGALASALCVSLFGEPASRARALAYCAFVGLVAFFFALAQLRFRLTPWPATSFEAAAPFVLGAHASGSCVASGVALRRLARGLRVGSHRP